MSPEPRLDHRHTALPEAVLLSLGGRLTPAEKEELSQLLADLSAQPENVAIGATATDVVLEVAQTVSPESLGLATSHAGAFARPNLRSQYPKRHWTLEVVPGTNGKNPEDILSEGHPGLEIVFPPILK